MRTRGLLISAVILLGIGLGLLIGYCNGTTGFNFAYPLSGSMVHIAFTTAGPAALSGVILTVIGAILLVCAFFAAIIGLFTWSERPVRERVVQRYSVVPAADTSTYTTTEAPVEEEERKHFWSRPESRGHI